MSIQHIQQIPTKWGPKPGVPAHLKLLPVSDQDAWAKDRNYSVRVDKIWYWPALIAEDNLDKTVRALYLPTSKFLTIRASDVEDVVDYEGLNGKLTDYIRVLAEHKQFSIKHLKAIGNKEFTEDMAVFVQCKELQKRGYYVTSNRTPTFPSNLSIYRISYVTWTKPWVTLYNSNMEPFLHS